MNEGEFFLFNNLINIYDFRELLRILKSKPNLFSKISHSIFSSRKQKVELAWTHTDSAPTHWWDLPEITARWNYLITGDEEKEYYNYFTEKYLDGKNSLSALSLACGTGSRELKWFETKKFYLIDAYDLSKKRIDYAIKIAGQKGYDKVINYKCADIYEIPIKEDFYDIIFGEQSLHHLTPLDELFLRVKKMLKPDGYFLINEYVGADRFQWDEKQLRAANDLLQTFPIKFRKYWKSNTIKKRVYAPSRLRMLLSDPSEAVESSNILPMLDKHFELIEMKNYGGTILQLVFDKIAHNFLTDDLETKNLLKQCFDFEDKLISEGKLKSNFIFAVYKNKN